MRSAIMIVVTFVGTDGMSGRIDASTTRNASTPRTLPQASTIAVGSEEHMACCRSTAALRLPHIRLMSWSRACYEMPGLRARERR